jgi:hypothetical protein
MLPPVANNYRAARRLNILGAGGANPMTRIEWASPTQRAVFKWGPTPMLAAGGFGASKTYATCLKALWLSDVYPGNRGVIGRRVWDELKKTTMATFFKLCPPEAWSHGGRRADSDKVLRLNNGSEILWLHLNQTDVDIKNVLRGLEINWFLLDQAEEIEEEMFDILLGRLGRWEKARVPRWQVESYEWTFGRPWPWRHPADNRPIPPTYALLTCNPDTELHWLYRRFHPDSPAWQDRYRALGYHMFTLSSLDNRFLPEQNRAELMLKDESFKRRFVYGLWGIPEGQIHEIHPSSIIPGTPQALRFVLDRCQGSLYRILDHGDASPTCCLWAGSDSDGNVFIYREYYQADRLVSDHRREVAALSLLDKGFGSPFDLADPAIFHKVMQKHGGRWSVADEYADSTHFAAADAIYWRPADNNEIATRNRINEYLRFDAARIHPFTKERGAARVFFVERAPDYPLGCWYAIRETRGQRRKKTGTDLGKPVFSDDRDPGVPDHAYDCLRYLIGARPPLSSRPETRRRPEFYFLDHKQPALAAVGAGRGVLYPLPRRF